MPTQAEKTVASRTKLISKSTFNNYDACLNPYVGCEFGCSYCYVRFFIKDPNKEWGEFVRVRMHMEDKLPKELQKGYLRFDDGTETHKDPETGEIKKRKKKKDFLISETRLVIGTMTDPYQPAEKKYKITRKALEILTDPKKPQFAKVGIFTRSPLVLNDLDLIKKLPNARVHFTITPYPPEVLRVIEPYASKTSRRWQVVEKLKEAGIRTHVNISPVMPIISEGFTEEFVNKLVDLEIDEYFVDPMQPYSDSFEAFKESCKSLEGVEWHQIEQTMLDKERYLDWKMDFFTEWNEARKKVQHKAPKQMPIWSDHENKVWIDMRTGQQMSKRKYGDDL